MQPAVALMAQALGVITQPDKLSIDRSDANAQFALALALCELHRHDEAETYFTRAAQLHSGYAEARFTLGNQRFDAGDFEGAARHYAAFANRYPQDAQGWINLGLSRMHAGDWKGACAVLEKAVALAPGNPKPAAMLATALKHADASAADLIPALQRATALNPGRAELHLDLARALIGAYCYREAKAALHRVLELDPANTTAEWLDYQYPDDAVAPTQSAREQYLSRWRAGTKRFLTLDWSEPRYAEQANTTLAAATNFHLAYLGLPLVEEQRQNAQILRRLTLAAAPGTTEIVPSRIFTARRKVAIFSPSLHAHSVSKVWAGALLALDPAEFELHVFHPHPSVDATAERFLARATRFESGIRSADEWIAALRTLAPDVLIFLDVGMHQFVQAIASLRLAPVQVATWAHPVTTGMATIDYFLSAAACEPEDADQHYSERLVRLPHLGAWLELPESLPSRSPQARGGQEIRFLCVQSADKLHPGHDLLFARVLAATPGATLDVLCNKPVYVAEALAARMRAAFTQAGIDFDARCRVHAQMPFDEYRSFLARAHVCLDSLDFSGGVTSLDCLWHDLPIVTLPGALMRGRQTFGMLTLLDLPELIACDMDDYVSITAKLAHDAAWRTVLVERIAARKASLYCDQSVVDALAQFLRDVQPPDQATTPPPRIEVSTVRINVASVAQAPLDRVTGEAAFREGLALGRAGQWQAAANAMALAWRAAPDWAQAAQALLECAQQLTRRGEWPPAPELPLPATGRISFVVCSITPAKLERLQRDLAAHLQGEDWELVHVSDARSLAEGYMRGLARARGELIVFCHDDIGVLCDHFSARLRGRLSGNDLIGVAGTSLLNGPAWAWAGPPYTASWVAQSSGNDELLCSLLGTSAPVLPQAQALDGVFLAGHRSLFETLRFDTDTFDGFHLYDVDLSWRAHGAGYRCAVALDLLLWHESGGNFGATWSYYAERFIGKFPQLAPTSKQPPYQPGVLALAARETVAPIYGWIEHWLTPGRDLT